MNIQDRAMLVSLSIRQWSARKYDKKISKEVAETHNTSEDVGRYNKVLIAKSAGSTLKLIGQKLGDLRTWHYQQTLPWMNNGDRILPAANFEDYTAKVRERMSEVDDLADTFSIEYPLLVDEARERLNGLFRAEDYPEPAAIRDKFKIEVDFFPVPSAQDWRVDLSEDETNAIKRRIEETAQQATEKAMLDLWDRLYTVVNHIRERLSDPDKRFKDSLIANAHELCDILPRMNIADDQELNDMAFKLKQLIGTVNPSDLRETGKNSNWKRDRLEVASDAERLCDMMVGYM